MNADDFIEKFAFAIEVEAATLALDTRFKDLPNWDSLNTLAVIAMADADYGASLTGSDIQNSQTVGELMQVVQGRMG
ncbi:MAG: acyl carrier protein [Dokdonella sp.]|uniref:phosphopantetheine-binding protein n=1 Tax=Dokdonella sp. TaxID=2291710 RepID=UPI0025BC3476|nr:phosphopantetheine-binding protein [Dokdonella sp.]MBZ0224263.1 acyl carrier protein [Dokdonella sp.]